MNYENVYISNKQEKLLGRYITLEHIEPILLELNTSNQLQTIGFSVNKKPIYSYTIGFGKIKILMWSQMHGNESTTTKAVFDLLNLLHSGSELANSLQNNFTFCIIPMLNPDGAKLYTRENINRIDLNRDFKDLSQPESTILMSIFKEFNPNYCYNMHDQRTIYGAGNTAKPATVSFLAPSYNQNRDFNETRFKAVAVIVAMNKVLQQFIPEQIGRFDDEYNDNCAGDNFQKLGISTILFEAGHFQCDYDREMTRKYIFIALLSGFLFLEQKKDNENVKNYEKYLRIPQNKLNFYDFIYKNVQISFDGIKKSINFAAQYEEVLENNEIKFKSRIIKIGDLENSYGHVEFDAEDKQYSDKDGFEPKLDSTINFNIGSNIKIVNGVITNISD